MDEDDDSDPVPDEVEGCVGSKRICGSVDRYLYIIHRNPAAGISYSPLS